MAGWKYPSVGPWLGHVGQGVQVLEVLVLGRGVLVLGQGVLAGGQRVP